MTYRRLQHFLHLLLAIAAVTTAIACGGSNTPSDGGATDAGADFDGSLMGDADIDAGSGSDAGSDAGCPDGDADGVCDDVDVCSGNDATGDTDADGVCNDDDACNGNNASGDPDGDGVCQDVDNCDPIFNPAQEDVVVPGGDGDACKVVFVRAGATGAANGTSWADAFTNVQAAVTAALADLPTGPLKEVWIAEGTYRAAANAVVLEMVQDLEVYGGFVGTESQRSARPAILRQTVLSGDASGDDAPLTRAEVEAERNAPDHPNRTDNASRVVLMVAGARLDGVIVADGYSASVQNGIGILVLAGSTGVELHRVLVRNNVGAVLNASGAGLSVDSAASVEVTASEFVENIAWNGAGIEGLVGSTMTIRDTTFEENGTIGGQGTGVRSSGSFAIENCGFFANEMLSNGGGAVHSHVDGSGTLLNVLFDRNVGRRGALQLSGSGVYTLTNVTIASTMSSGSEGALWATANTSLVNVVFWNNQAGDLDGAAVNLPGSIVHSCSAADLSTFGTGNVRLDSSTAALGDPFTVGPEGQLFLKHVGAGSAVTSACVDAGRTNPDPDVYFPAWSSLTTRADGVLDGANADDIDMGFHFVP